MSKDEQEQPKTIAWYETQTKELMDIRKAYYDLCDDGGGDAYFPDLVKKKFQELKDLNILQEDNGDRQTNRSSGISARDR